jgi:hypothetical protein
MLCGSMIRDCLQQPVLHRMFLFAPDATMPKMTVELFGHLASEHFEARADVVVGGGGAGGGGGGCCC